MKPFNEPLINEMSAFIKEYQLNKGVSPSYSVISTRFRISKSVVARYLKQLEMRGMLRKNNDGVIAIDTKLFKGNTKPTSLVPLFEMLRSRTRLLYIKSYWLSDSS